MPAANAMRCSLGMCSSSRRGKTVFPRYIINFPTKRHWRGKSRIEDIESGLVSLAKAIRSHGIRSIAIRRSEAGWADCTGRRCVPV